MKALQTIIAVAALLHAANTFAQTEEVEDATSYKAEVFGSASSGSTTPFWMVSNRYGIVPLDANNGYLNAGVFHQQYLGISLECRAGYRRCRTSLPQCVYSADICRVRI